MCGGVMKKPLIVCLSILVAAVALGLVAAQTKLGPKDMTPMAPSDLTRIKVGDEAPDFTLEDQDGKPVTLSDFRGKKSVVLVFYRGSW
jgi:cytochrome oxidase Cu insertion factor (SCO1/SenC/PrrC family)